MATSARTKAETRLAAIRLTPSGAPDEQEMMRRERAERTAKLRALRLARETAEKNAAANEAKLVKEDESPDLPQVHRRQC